MNNWQQDPSLKNIPLGDGSTTIGASGCTVSAIGDAINITADVVNYMLKKVNGFLGALVIWAKIAEAFPGITAYRYWTYNNDDVVAQLAKGNRVIVEVPATPIGGTGSHWVEYIGNHQLKDPWTGHIRPTSDFPNPTGYCVISGTWQATENPIPQTQGGGNGMANMYGSPNQYDLNNPNSMKIAVDVLNKVLTSFYVEKTKYDADIAVAKSANNGNQDIVNKYNQLKQELKNFLS